MKEVLVIVLQLLFEVVLQLPVYAGMDLAAWSMTCDEKPGAVGCGTIEGTVEQWMTRDPITVGPDATNGEAAMMMIHGGFRHVPICDQGKLIGVVSIRDLLTLPNESPKGV